jgi:hypothetical protein
MDLKAGARSHGGSALSATAYAGAAIVGVIGANYASGELNSALYSLVGGAIIFAVPVFLLHENSGMMGPVRLGFAVAGLTLIARGIVGNGTAGSGLINVPLPQQVGAVI